MKTDKNILCALAVIVLLWGLPSLGAEAKPDEKAEKSPPTVQTQRYGGPGGRFQLFNAEYNSATLQGSKATKFLEKGLFKIDTRTGASWMLIDMFKDGRDIKYWKKIK